MGGTISSSLFVKKAVVYENVHTSTHLSQHIAVGSDHSAAVVVHAFAVAALLIRVEIHTPRLGV
jgi:hypothetical protein